MISFKSLRRSVSTLTASTLVLGLFAFAPNSLAAGTLSFNPEPSKEYTIGSGNYQMSVKLDNLTEDTFVTVSLESSGGNGLMIPMQTKEYDTNGQTNAFSIDMTGYAAGTYDVEVVGENANDVVNTDKRSYQLVVKNKDVILIPIDKPVIDYSGGAPNSEYTIGSTNYRFSIILENYTSDTIVDVNVENLGNGLMVPTLKHEFDTENEVHEFSLDLNEEGTYDIEVIGKDEGNVSSNKLAFTVTAKNQVIVADTNCAGFKDVDADDKNCAAVKFVNSAGIMTGNDDGTFDLSGPLQRDESVKVSLIAAGLYNANSDYCDGNNPFPDVTGNAWSKNYVCRAVDLGVATGYKAPSPDAGYFKPARTLNLIEMLAIILRNVDEPMPKGSSFNDNFALDQWYSGYAAFAYDNSLYPSSNSLMPTKTVTRGEMAQFLYKLDQKGLLN